MNELIKKNILIVGATGVIGSSVSAFLKDIYCLTLTSSKKRPLNESISIKSIEYCKDR